MPETPTEEVPANETVADDPTTEDSSQDGRKPTETVDFWKAKSRENEKRAKENAAAAKELAELKEAQKSEAQKWQERAEAAENALEAHQAVEQVREWKAQAAEKFGVPADVIRGVTPDEIHEHAQSLQALLPEPRKAGHVPAEGRAVATGSGDPAQQFASILKQQLNN